jgi:hypothetical protein
VVVAPVLCPATDDQDLLLNGTATMPTLARDIVEQGVTLTGFVVRSCLCHHQIHHVDDLSLLSVFLL